MQIDASDERLSKYDLIRPIGSGGMGEVYLALDTVLKRQVAIKFVSPARVGDPAASRRLLHEARAAAALEHPCICPVYDVHVDPAGRTCIVMQYVEGETLARRLGRGPLGATAAVELAIRIAGALEVAHAHGIVHRDLKPQNVVIAPDGRPTLLDFGIAQTRVSPEALASIETHTDTADGLTGLVGTPAYMSPEQVLQKPVDGRSDLFSLGAVLFECLTGTPAFQASTDIDTWARVVYMAPPRPSSLDPGLPRGLDRIVARLLAKDPRDRFATAAEVVRALDACRAETTLGPGASRSRRRLRRVAAAAVAATVAVAGYLAWRSTSAEAPPAPPAAEAWYQRGTAHIRDGAYYSAELALKEALRLHPDYPQALTRLAQSQSELDEESEARASLLRVDVLLQNAGRLPRDDGLRLEAIRALATGNVSGAVSQYQRIADRNPRDSGVWLDLARAQQIAGLREDARRSSAASLQIDGQSSAAHLRMAGLAAEAVRREEALREFAEAERLYRTAANREGETEAILQRAMFLDAIGEDADARISLDRVTDLLAQTGNPYQRVRAALLRSSLTASTGDFAGARRLSQDALDIARQHGLETVAADALIEAATALARLNGPTEAATMLTDAIDLARRHGANRVAARGTLQLASIDLALGRPDDARALAEGVLDFVRRSQFKRYEMIAESIIARAAEGVDDREAERRARRVLAAAESLRDDREVALALDGLAAPTLALGSLPEALVLRTRLETLLRRQQDTPSLASTLVNRAELLIRLGRFDQADLPLQEIERGAAAGIEPFVQRQRRVSLVRALGASERHDFAAAEHYAADVVRASASLKTPDGVVWIAEALATNAAARLGRRPAALAAAASAWRELRYWRATALLAVDQPAAAAAEVTTSLADIDRRPSPEYEWRMAAIGAAAALRQRDPARAGVLTARARAALARLRADWKSDAADYERRADLAECRRGAGLS